MIVKIKLTDIYKHILYKCSMSILYQKKIFDVLKYIS